MPLAKAVLERSSLAGEGLVDADQLSVLVVDALRQLARLAVICDVMFTELVSEADDVRDRVVSLTSRTERLAQRLDALDALTVIVRTYTHAHDRLFLSMYQSWTSVHCLKPNSTQPIVDNRRLKPI